MSAETLRRAAALMRERAERVQAQLDNPGIVYSSFPGAQQWMGDHEHIASWHPAVALAVAEWMDEVAVKEAGRESVGSVFAVVGIEHALALARAYLDEEQP